MFGIRKANILNKQIFSILALNQLRKVLRQIRLKYYKFRHFGDNYVQGQNTVSDLKKIIVNQFSSGQIILGDYVICNAELYCFLGNGIISIGDYSYIGQNSRIWALKSIHIGKRVLISHNVFIVDNLTHPMDPQMRHQQYMAKYGYPFPQNINLEEKEIIIEDDVWIAANVIILSGVHIGKGAVIGAGSVITKNVAAGSVVAGNPAKVLRES